MQARMELRGAAKVMDDALSNRGKVRIVLQHRHMATINIRQTSLWETNLARIDDMNSSETTNTCHDNLSSQWS
jgi:hypothetical protein